VDRIDHVIKSCLIYNRDKFTTRGNFNQIPWRRHPIKSGVE